MRALRLSILILIVASISIFFWILHKDSLETERYDESRWSQELIDLIEAGPKYLSRDMFLEIPRTPSLQETQKEIDFLKDLEKQRTLSDELEINAQINEIRLVFFEEAGVKYKNKPLTLSLMKEVSDEVGFFILREKWRIQRLRPYDLESNLKISIAPPPHSSYPSGHGGQSWSMAILLSQLNPDRSDYWFQAAKKIGQNREKAGVHFPSDTRAGQIIADQVMGALLKNEEFLEKLETVRREEWSESLSL